MSNSPNTTDHQDTSIRPAATVLLLRDSDDGLQTLLLRRNKALKFAGGSWVFPGGRIDQNEIDQADDLDQAARNAAVREAQEESGLVVEACELVHFGHWTTPIGMPKRFATWFFAAPLNSSDGQDSGRVEVDGGEIHEFQWLTPAEALTQHRALELTIMIPTFICLRLLQPYATVAEAMVALRQMTPYQVTPNSLKHEGRFVSLYPGDAGFEMRDPNLPGERHRCFETDQGYVYEHSGAGVGVAPMDKAQC